MTTEVEGTCVSVEDKTEADWAMMYAEEARRRVKAERRLNALLFAVGGLIQASRDALEAVMKPVTETSREHMQVTISELASLAMEAFDCEVMTNLNTFDPTSGVEPHIQEALANVQKGPPSPTDERILKQYFGEMTENHQGKYEEACREWALICQENNFHAAEEVRKQRQREFSRQVMAKSMSDEKILEQLKSINKPTTH